MQSIQRPYFIDNKPDNKKQILKYAITAGSLLLMRRYIVNSFVYSK